MNIKKLNEELKKQLHEIELDKSFRDYQDARKAAAAEKIKGRFGNDIPVKTLNKIVGEEDASKLLKTIYRYTKINLQNGGIKEIPVPKSVDEAKNLLDDTNALLLQRGNRLAILIKYEGNLTAQWSPNQEFTDAVEYNFKRLSLDSPKNLAQAFNKGLFQKAWLVYGGKTDELTRKRRDAYIGSDQDKREYGKRFSNSEWGGADKSGYEKRNLSRELLELTRAARRQNFNMVKANAGNLKKLLINQIRNSEIEDYDTDILLEVINGLKDIETSRLSDYDLDDARSSQRRLEDKIQHISGLINQL